MEELHSWWDIAQAVGAGATFVLGPLAYFLWRAREEDLKYIREADKNTLRILSELTIVMQTDGKDGERRQVELLKAIQHSVESIKAHFDASKSH